MKRWLFLSLMFIFLPLAAVLAQQAITGVVVDEEKEPLIGVSVSLKGTTTGVMTDLDGKYSINVPAGSTLSFDYLGMEAQNIKTTASTSILDVTLKSTAQKIDEVIVTAMGVVQEKKRMNFAVTSIGADDVLAAKSPNFIDALQGKVAGVNISSTGGSPNANSTIQIRAVASISGDNGPLFVIDGMQSSGGASLISAMNPNDIENITILKGAAASALYGQDGANGVVMVTTKSGEKGRTTVNVSSSLQVDNAVRIPKIQRMYGMGSNGIVSSTPGIASWGPLLPENADKYNNAEDFFRTALFHKQDVSISAGGENFSTYASVTYSGQEGVVPEDYINRVGILLKSSVKISPTLSASFIANVLNSEARDAGSTSGYMGTVYGWPINHNMKDYANPDGSIKWLYDDPANPQSTVLNPYWRRYKDYGAKESTTNLLQTQVVWKAIKNLELSGRLGYEHTNYVSQAYTTERYTRKELPNATDNSLYGSASRAQVRANQLTAQAIARYNYKINKDFNLEFMLGTEMKQIKNKTTRVGGTEFDVQGFYSVMNLKNSITGYNKDNYIEDRNKDIYGYFGEVRIDYKGVASLSATQRNDHSSTLWTDKNSYWYPSFTAGLVFTELFDISNNIITFGKLRGNWAKTGKDTDSYKFGKKYALKPTFPDQGSALNPGLSVARTDLQPEMYKSWEIGADLRFFQNKTRLDIAYYSTGSDNQIVAVRVSPTVGEILQTRNEGSIENQGMEISLDQDIMKRGKFNWTANVNFSYNRGKLKSMPDGITELLNTNAQIGSDIFPAAFVGGSTTAIVGKDYLRNNDGQIICDAEGYPMISPAKSLYIGNREADFRMGFGSNFSYDAWKLSFLFDIKKGGDVVNGTARSLLSNGQHRALETYRNREVVVDGVVLQADGSYAPNTTPVILDQRFLNQSFSEVSSNFIEDGSYIRLSHVTIGYDFSKFIKKTIFKSLNASFTSRNLFLITKYTGSDPQVSFTDSNKGSGSSGLDNLGIPNTRSFNISLNATF